MEVILIISQIIYVHSILGMGYDLRIKLMIMF